MSRVGHYIDNGPTKGFWGMIKPKMYAVKDESALRFAIKDYISFTLKNKFKIDSTIRHHWK